MDSQDDRDSAFQNNLSDNVAKAALSTYSKLPKRGKPQRNKEWTLLSAVIMRKQGIVEGICEIKKIMLLNVHNSLTELLITLIAQLSQIFSLRNASE